MSPMWWPYSLSKKPTLYTFLPGKTPRQITTTTTTTTTNKPSQYTFDFEVAHGGSGSSSVGCSGAEFVSLLGGDVVDDESVQVARFGDLEFVGRIQLFGTLEPGHVGTGIACDFHGESGRLAWK